MSAIAELLERVRAATGPDRELDARLHLWERPEFGAAPWIQPEIGKWLRMDGRPSLVYAPHFTSSIDAALALTERMLPGAEMHITLNHPKNDWQTASIRVAPLKLVSGEEATLPIAILAATLQALASQEPQP